jgi:hypothetical protein
MNKKSQFLIKVNGSFGCGESRWPLSNIPLKTAVKEKLPLHMPEVA